MTKVTLFSHRGRMENPTDSYWTKSYRVHGKLLGYVHGHVERNRYVIRAQSEITKEHSPDFRTERSAEKWLRNQAILENPRGRSTGSLHRPSQATGKAPSKRLVSRRRATKNAPDGYFANPDTYFGIHLNAGNDTNGNPRRLVVLYRHEGSHAKLYSIVDEGYAGVSGAIREAGLDPETVPVVGQFTISAKEYRELKAKR